MLQFQSKGLQARDPGKPMVQTKPESSLLENSLLPGEAGDIVLFRPLTDWMRLIHIMEGNLLTQSLLSNI